MLAQDRHEHSDATGRSASKRQSRQPAKFMFIDSSNGGVNAKPDRVVRSFVMKSARNKKTWSTRPRSPKEEDDVDTKPPELPAQQVNIQHDHTFAVETWGLHDYRKDSLWDTHSLASPASSRTGSIFSTYSSGRTCDSPSSCYTSPLVEYPYPESAYNFPTDKVRTLVVGDGVDIQFAGSLDCLPVQLDVHTQRLLHQCKCILTHVPCSC